MNNMLKMTVAVLLLLAVAAGGYWFGTRANAIADGQQPAPAATAERKLLYYRNPMGLPDTSPVPKKDSMGMDYVAVYEGDDASGSQLSISSDKVQKLGVKSEAVTLRELKRTLRVSGRVEVDERRSYTIAPKFEGWVERLYVNTTGQAVSKGQALFEVYSPELVSAQREHALALQGLATLKDADDEAKNGMQKLADASAARLQNWNVAASAASGEGAARVTFRAPVNGIVLEKRAVQGMRFMPGEVLYQIADLSSVWVIADVAEQDIALVQPGSRAQLVVDAYAGRTFDGKVSFIYPTLNSATRTVQVRMEIANPQGLLKPAMFATAQLAVGKADKVLAVPTSAVIDSGTRQIVLVQLQEGRFEPRSVRLGSRSDDYVEVLQGLQEGEQVVTSANFLIDAESNLKAALSGMGGQTMATAPGDTEPVTKSATVGHQTQGVLEAINDDGSVSITHEPIKSLKWPAMTMEFALANTALTAGIAPGSSITFEIVERNPGEWVVTRMKAAPQPHGGH
jgi:Cu(I)/Ag(I) efflux system membrane fusion protein